MYVRRCGIKKVDVTTDDNGAAMASETAGETAPDTDSAPADHRALDKQIVRLALPAFAALVSEPLFLLADAAIVGHLGVDQLAALGIAGTVVATLTGIFVFLAY